MTRQEMVAFLRQARETATDEAAVIGTDLYPAWMPGESVEAGTRKRYNGILYKALTTHTTQENWTPDSAPSLWAKVLIPDPEVIPEWEQPDSTNAYQRGDKVLHSGKTWESFVDNNIWEPGVIGTEGLWKEILE